MNLDKIKANAFPVYYKTDTYIIRVRKAHINEKSTNHKSGIQLTTDLIIIEPEYQPRFVVGTITPILIPNYTNTNVNEEVIGKEYWDNKVKELTNKLL